jgi:hypothetical protein
LTGIILILSLQLSPKDGFYLAMRLYLPGEQVLNGTWTPLFLKQTIIDFVKNVTDPTSTNYVPPDKRIATFDNDGTLWAENPFTFKVILPLIEYQL